MREGATDIVDSVYANFVAYYETYMYRSRNITKNSKNNSHVHNTLGWDNICKYDLRKMSMRLSRHILYLLHKKECLCMYAKYVHLCKYIRIYTNTFRNINANTQKGQI